MEQPDVPSQQRRGQEHGRPEPRVRKLEAVFEPVIVISPICAIEIKILAGRQMTSKPLPNTLVAFCGTGMVEPITLASCW